MTRQHLLIAAAFCAMPFTMRAQTPAATLQACFVPKSGTMYIVGQPGAPDKCRSTDHVALTWNVTGPAGASGAVGTPGPAGPQGPAGSATLTGSGTLASLEYVIGEKVLGVNDGNAVQYVVATCPEGKVAIGGGLLGPGINPFYAGTAKVSYLQFVGSYPNAAFGYSPREWVTQVQVTDSPSLVGRVRSVAVCAKVN